MDYWIKRASFRIYFYSRSKQQSIGRLTGANRFLETYDFIINFLDENNDIISSINLADSPSIEIDQDVFISKIILSYAPKQNPMVKASIYSLNIVG